MSNIQEKIEKAMKLFSSPIQMDNTPSREIKHILEDIAQEAVEEERMRILGKIEDIFNEFGDQGVELVGNIINETFHGQEEIFYGNYIQCYPELAFLASF